MLKDSIQNEDKQAVRPPSVQCPGCGYPLEYVEGSWICFTHWSDCGIAKDEYKIIGSRIRQARERRGETQKELGTCFGSTQSMVAAYEGGRRRIGITDLGRVADRYGVSVLHLLGRETGGGQG